MIGLLVLPGIILIILAIAHVVPFLLGILLGIVLVVAGGGLYEMDGNRHDRGGR